IPTTAVREESCSRSQRERGIARSWRRKSVGAWLGRPNRLIPPALSLDALTPEHLLGVGSARISPRPAPRTARPTATSTTRFGGHPMRRTFILAILAASISMPIRAAFTPPASPSYCPWPAWHLPDAQPGDPIVYTDPHGVTYTKPQIDSAYDQVCWQQDSPATGTRDSAMTADFRTRLPPERYAYGPSQFEGLDLY